MKSNLVNISLNSSKRVKLDSFKTLLKIKSSNYSYFKAVKYFVSNYIPEKRKFSGILCFRQQRRRRRRRAAAAPPPPRAAAAAPPPHRRRTAAAPPTHRRRRPPRHNFVVSAITFEGFKLRSSNLTHALFIQISRTSSITDIVVQSKMAAGGHFVQKFKKKVAYRSEMARTVIESYFRTSKMAAGGHFVPKL